MMIALLLLLPGLAAPSGGASVERLLDLMGTEARLVIVASDRAAALAASEGAVRALEETEARLSTWRPDSELARLNRSPVGRPVALSPELLAELRSADDCRRATGGAFDPGIGALVTAWGLRQGGRGPTPGELEAALAVGGMAALELGAGTATRHHPDLRLEEGGFGKGAALDRALAAVAGAPGVAAAALDLGGQVARLPGRPDQVAIADPWDRARGVLALTIDGGSVATSGNSERGILVAGQRLSHLLDPRTGRPVRDFGSLTVWTAGALAADCLSTGLYVLGPEAAVAWAAAHPGVEVVALRRRGDALEALASPALAGRLEPLVEGVEVRFATTAGDEAAARGAASPRRRGREER